LIRVSGILGQKIGNVIATMDVTKSEIL